MSKDRDSKDKSNDVIHLDIERELASLIEENPNRIGTPSPENVEDWVSFLSDSGLSEGAIRQAINQELIMKSKLVSLRLKKEIEEKVEEELEIMRKQQPWQNVTFSMAIRSLIYDGLTRRQEQREQGGDK